MQKNPAENKINEIAGRVVRYGIFAKVSVETDELAITMTKRSSQSPDKMRKLIS